VEGFAPTILVEASGEIIIFINHISVVGLSCFLLPSIISMIFLIPYKIILHKNQSKINMIPGRIFLWKGMSIIWTRMLVPFGSFHSMSHAKGKDEYLDGS
jgi:hypothetical protein